MDASAVAEAGRGLASPAQNGRKQWRVVSEHHSSRDPSDGEADRFHSDERTIYEQGREPVDVNLSSITTEGSMQNDILQQQLNHVTRQREEFQQLEVELRARVIARSEIMELKKRFETQVKEHANNATLLQEQINDRDQIIQELERKMEEKDREMHAIKLDNEEAWAKEGLLREKNKELASIRRERDNSEVERVQYLQQIHDLQEHVKEKERQFLELQEQRRVAQEAIIFKDEQLREAQAWMTRAHEMDTLHSTTIHSLQAELRERTEQYNQLWIGCQRQFAEMERVHFIAIQQLQLELVEARERNGVHKEEPAASHSSTKDSPQVGHDNGQHDANGSVGPNGKCAVYSNGNKENATNVSAVGNASQAEHNPGVPFTPPLLGLSPYVSPGQMAVRPYLLHQQGLLNPTPSHAPQNHVAHFQSVQTNAPTHFWQNQPYEMPVDGQTLPSQYADSHISREIPNGAVIVSTSEEPKDQKLTGNLVDPQFQHSLQDISTEFQDTLHLNQDEDKKIQVASASDSSDQDQESRSHLNTNTGINTLVSDAPVHPRNDKEITSDSTITVTSSLLVVSNTQTNATSVGITSDSLLLDERLLLACVARTMPACGKIRVSSTLPNRLAKMLAPLHWHDYKKTYGKLEDFVAGHPELFVVEGNFIQLREGAQKKIAATAAAAKLAAAAAAPSPYNSVLSSVAVTPMAHSYRLKRTPSSEVENNTHSLGNQPKHFSGIHLNVSEGQSGTKNVLSSAGNLNLTRSENRFIYSNASDSTGNGTTLMGSANSRVPANLVARQHGRAPGTAPNSQR